MTGQYRDNEWRKLEVGGADLRSRVTPLISCSSSHCAVKIRGLYLNKERPSCSWKSLRGTRVPWATNYAYSNGGTHRPHQFLSSARQLLEIHTQIFQLELLRVTPTLLASSYAIKWPPAVTFASLFTGAENETPFGHASSSACWHYVSSCAIRSHISRLLIGYAGEFYACQFWKVAKL
jgi:hypothetical protein